MNTRGTPKPPNRQTLTKKGLTTAPTLHTIEASSSNKPFVRAALISMAFFTADKLKRRQITIDPSSVSSQSPEVQNRLRRIDENYQAFDELFADIETTIQNDERLREFNANLRAVDLQPKKKRRWRSQSGQNGAKGKKKTAASASAKKSTGRRAAVGKIKDAQIRLSKSAGKTPPANDSSKHKRLNKKPR